MLPASRSVAIPHATLHTGTYKGQANKTGKVFSEHAFFANSELLIEDYICYLT
jgi:hypothetical protein